MKVDGTIKKTKLSPTINVCRRYTEAACPSPAGGGPDPTRPDPTAAQRRDPIIDTITA